MTLATLTKDPDEVLDYDVDYARWLPDGDTIDDATAELTGSTAVITQTDVSSTAVKVWISGGAAGDSAMITVRAATTLGRIKEATFRLRIKDS